MTAKQSLLILACVTGFASGALAQEKKPEAAAKVNYDEHILPILREKCLGCHNADKKSGGLVLANYSSLMAGGSSGEIVFAGDVEGSRLYALVAHKEEPFMPPK